MGTSVIRYTNKALARGIRRHGWSVGRGSYGVPKVMSWGEDARLHIGAYCSISAGVTILLGGNHRVDWATTYPFNYVSPAHRHITGHPATRGDVRIGNDVWLGLGCVVLSGVTIGDGACVGARAVVTKDVPPYAIVAGNPAELVRYRFGPETIERLLALRWWDWPPERIEGAVPLLLSDDIEGLLRAGAEGEISAPAERTTLAGVLHRLAALWRGR